MKISELRQLNIKKLFEQLRKSRRELAICKFHIQTGQKSNTNKISDIKKTIARTFTLLKQN